MALDALQWYEQKGGTVTYATVAIWRCCLSWAGGNHSVRSARIRQPTAVNRNRVRRLLMRTFGIQPSPPSASSAFLLHVVRKTPHDCSQPKAVIIFRANGATVVVLLWLDGNTKNSKRAYELIKSTKEMRDVNEARSSSCATRGRTRARSTLQA